MNWLTVFTACFVAVVLGGALISVIIAWFVGRSRNPLESSDPISIALRNQPDYPVDENGELKGMDPPSESDDNFESLSLRLD